MKETLRDSIVGQAINRLSHGKLLPYPDQRADFIVPSKYLKSNSGEEFQLQRGEEDGTHSRDLSPSATLAPTPSNQPSRLPSARASQETFADRSAHKAIEKATHIGKPVAEVEKGEDPNLVTWYGDDDPENPHNWSGKRKAVLLASIQLLTFTVYIGSAIYTPSIPGVMEQFGVSQVKALLPLSMYVLAYGIGPMIFSPLSEVPSFGRLNVYMITLFIFMILQIPTALAPNFETLVAMRFFAGLVCSPALSTGGATLADVFSPMSQPYVVALWAAGAVAGPVTGPVAGGYAAQEENWRWPLYMLLFLSVFCFMLLSFTFAETSADNILLRRAQRLRKLTGNENLRSQSEIDQAEISLVRNVGQSLLRPFLLLLEPMVFFIDMYIALVYAIFYLWFEGIPLVFTGIHGFGLGASGLAFCGFVVALIPTLLGYFAYQKYHVIPTFKRDGLIVPETRLTVALVGSFFIPAALFIFGWTSRPDVSYWGPIVGASLYLPGIYLIFQGAIVYLGQSYGKYAASVLASNALLRGITGATFPLFGHALFVNLGIGPASSLLAGLAIIMIPPLYLLYRYGAKLRVRSKYATA